MIRSDEQRKAIFARMADAPRRFRNKTISTGYKSHRVGRMLTTAGLGLVGLGLGSKYASRILTQVATAGKTRVLDRTIRSMVPTNLRSPELLQGLFQIRQSYDRALQRVPDSVRRAFGKAAVSYPMRKYRDAAPLLTAAGAATFGAGAVTRFASNVVIRSGYRAKRGKSREYSIGYQASLKLPRGSA
jgi:hypothetical protein